MTMPVAASPGMTQSLSVALGGGRVEPGIDLRDGQAVVLVVEAKVLP